jgi:hypothetical protein
VSDGNHDSSTTRQQEIDEGMGVLDGETIEAAGLRVLGDSDPERTPAFASGPETRYSATGETEEELGLRLREQASKDSPDIVLVHQPSAAEAFLEDESKPINARLVLWGHSHRLELPTVRWHDNGSYTIAQQLGTAGGIGEQRFDSLSTPLTTPTTNATAVAYRLNKETGEAFYQIITVSPDGDVAVSPWEQIVSAQDILVHTPIDELFSAPQPSVAVAPES